MNKTIVKINRPLGAENAKVDKEFSAWIKTWKNKRNFPEPWKVLKSEDNKFWLVRYFISENGPIEEDDDSFYLYLGEDEDSAKVNILEHLKDQILDEEYNY